MENKEKRQRKILMYRKNKETYKKTRHRKTKKEIYKEENEKEE
jgi:hypothetical protein